MKKEHNKKYGLLIGGIIIALIAFYAGMTYGGNNVRASIMSKSQSFGQSGGRGGRGSFGGLTMGSIIAKDDKSITVQVMSGGSKIIFLDSNTKVSKQAAGTLNDLSIGTEVSINGQANSDGSINADSVQIRPNTPPVVK